MPNEVVAQGIATFLVLGLGVLGWTGGADKVRSLERYAKPLNLAVTCGFLFSLAGHAVQLLSSGQSIALPPGRI